MGNLPSKKKRKPRKGRPPVKVETESVDEALESIDHRDGNRLETPPGRSIGAEHDSNDEGCSGTESSIESSTEEDGEAEAAVAASAPDEDTEPKSAERLQDEDNMRLALGLWLDVHLPRVKYNICLCLLGPPRSRPWWESDDSDSKVNVDASSHKRKKSKKKTRKRRKTSKTPKSQDGGSSKANGCVARVEAAGSGIVLLERLELPADAYVGLVKVMIAELLPDRPVPKQILFAGHGGTQMTGFYTELSEFVPAGSGVLTLALGRAAIADVRRGDQVCIGGLDDTNMEDLQKALQLPNPMQCLRALDLTPDSVPCVKKVFFCVEACVRGRLSVWHV